MKPTVKTAVATMQQVGRRFSSACSSNNNNIGICRVGSFCSVPSSPSQQLKKQQTSMTTRTKLARLTQQVVATAATQTRSKSSMAMNYDQSGNLATATTANATFDQSVREPFPSIVLGPEKSIEPKGPFAEAQAQVSHISSVYEKTLKC